MKSSVNRLNLRRSSAVVAAGTLLSRLTGLARDVVLAGVFGSSAVTDVFFAAFRIPNTFRRILAEGGVTVAVQPVYARLLEQGDEDTVRRFEQNLFGVARVLLVTLLVAGLVTSGPLIWAFASGYARNPELYAEARYLLRLMFPFIYFMGLIGVGMGLLHVRGRFLVPAAGPMLLNIGLIGGAGVAWWRIRRGTVGTPEATPLAIGVVLGVAAWWFWMRTETVRQGIATRSRVWPVGAEVRHVARLLLPALAGLSVYQLQVIVGTQFASLLPEGGFTCLWYADRLVQFPMAMIGTAVATVALPVLSSARVRGDDAERAVAEALQFAVFIVVPAAIGLYVVREPLVSLVFGWGRFGTDAIARTVAATGGLAVALVPGALNRVLTANLYSAEDMRPPIVAGALALIVQAACSWWWLEQDVLGLARAMAVASATQFLVLYLYTRRTGQRIVVDPVVLLITGAAAVGMYGVLRFVAPLMTTWPDGLRLAVSVVAGALVYGLLCVVLRHPEAQRLRQRLSRSR